MQPSNIAPPALRAEFDRIVLYMPDRRVYAIDPQGLGAIRAWLDEMWGGALQSFAAGLQSDGDDGKAGHSKPKE